MKTKRFIVLPLLLLAFGWVMGQTDVLFLKDGSVIRGTISEYIAGDHVRIKTEEGKYLEFPGDQVKKVGFKGEKSVFSLREKGYYNVSSLGLLFGINEWGGINVQPSLQMVQGYQFKGRMNVGLGTGLEIVRNQVVLPAFGEFRYHFKKEGFSPFVAANAGYNFLLAGQRYYGWYYGTELKSFGGIMGGVQVGLRNYGKQNLGWTCSLGYRYQQMHDRYYYYNSDLSFAPQVPILEYTRMHRIEARFGILFH